MRLLFITSSRVGDAILSTSILNHYITQHPDVKITVVCGNMMNDIFRAIPQVERILDVRKQTWERHWLKLWRDVVGTKWDVVVDVRNSALSRTVMAKQKFVLGAQNDSMQHRVVQMAQLIGVTPPPVPKLWFDGQTYERAMELIPTGEKVLAIAPAAARGEKAWDADKYIELVKRLRDKDAPFHGWRVAILTAPAEESQAESLFKSIHHTKRIDLMGNVTLIEAAACLSRCHFFIGNHTALMQMAVAVNIPTLGLFGPTWPQIYGPWGKYNGYIAAKKNRDAFAENTGKLPAKAPASVASISVKQVEAAAHKMLRLRNQ